MDDDNALPNEPLHPPEAPSEPDGEADTEPDAETLEMRNLLEQNAAARLEKAVEGERPVALPDSVKAAAILAIAHGALLALNSIIVARALGDMRLVPYNVIWFGLTIVMAGALFERQAWAWWGLSLFGGIAAIGNLLKMVAFYLYQAMYPSSSMLDGGAVAEKPAFSPVLIGLAGAAMLLSVFLLALPEAKAACGMAKEKPGGLF